MVAEMSDRLLSKRLKGWRQGGLCCLHISNALLEQTVTHP
jgi:hypothetical protein